MTGDIWGASCELTPLEDYDEKGSRQRISLKWLILKSHMNVQTIPKELTSPFYVDLDGNFNIKPILVNLLASGELYCQACANLFYEWQLPFHDMSSVICSLARKGFYVDEDNGIGVTESVLKQTSPLRLNSHLLLIEAMMEASNKNCITIEASVKAVRETGAKFSPSSDLPESHEDSLLFWIARVASASQNGRKTFNDILDNNESSLSSSVVEKNKSPQTKNASIQLDDLSDGVKLCVLLQFYYSHALFQDNPPFIPGAFSPSSPSSAGDANEMEQPVSLADSIHNLKLFLGACHALFSPFDFPFRDVRVEDVLYAHSALQPILFCMLSQVFASLTSRGLLKRDTHPRDVSSLISASSASTSSSANATGLPKINYDLENDHEDDDRSNGNFDSSTPLRTLITGDKESCSTAAVSSSPSASGVSVDGRRPQSLFPPSDSPLIPPISKVTKQSFVQQASLRSANGLLTPESPSFPHSSSSGGGFVGSSSSSKSPSLTPGVAKRLTGVVTTATSGDAFHFDVGAGDSVRSRPSSQRGQLSSKPRPKSAIEGGGGGGGATIYSALSSSGDQFGNDAFGVSADLEQTSLLEHCDLDDADSGGGGGGGSGGKAFITQRFHGTVGKSAGGRISAFALPDASGGESAKKIPRKKWRASADDEEGNGSLKLEFFGKPNSHSSAATANKDNKDINGGTWSKSSSPLVLSVSPQQPQLKKIGEKNLSSRSFNVGEKVITEQAARAANIPVIGGGGENDGDGEENLRVQFFLKKTPSLGSPQPLNSDAKAKVTTPFIPKFGNAEPKSRDGVGEDDKSDKNGDRGVVTTDQGDIGKKRSSLTMCGKVFLNGGGGGSENNESGSNNRLSALFGSCDNFPSVLGQSGDKTNENGHESKTTKAVSTIPPGATNFAEISAQKAAASGRSPQQQQQQQQRVDQAALASPKSSLKSARNSSDNATEVRLQNPTTWGAIGQERSEAETRDEQATTPNGLNGRSPLSIQLAAMRMRLEEKKRAIERDKIKAESRANKDRQRFGKTAFLKVIGANAGGSCQPSHESIMEERETTTPGTSPGQTTPTHDTSGQQPLSIKPEANNIGKIEYRRDSSSSDKESATALHSVPEEPSLINRMSESLEYVPQQQQQQKERLRSEGNESTGSRKSSSGNSSFEAASSNTLKTRIRTLSSGSDPPRDTPSPSSSVGTDNQCIDQLNASLFELQSEIKRLSLQQEQLKSMQSQFGQPPDYGGAVAAAPPTVFSPPRPEMMNGGFVGYNPQILPGPYSPYAHSMGMPGHLTSAIPQPQPQPVVGAAPIMMPTFSPSLNNLVQQPQPSNLALQAAQYGSMVSIPSGTSSPMPPYYMSQGNLNVSSGGGVRANNFSDVAVPTRTEIHHVDDYRRSQTRLSNEATDYDSRFDQFSGGDGGGGGGGGSSSHDKRDIERPPSHALDHAARDGEIVGQSIDQHRQQQQQKQSQKQMEPCFISFGGEGDSNVIVNRWKRDSEGDASLKECELTEAGLPDDITPRGGGGEDEANASFVPERSPRNVAWMTPPSSAGKVRESLAMQTPTSTNSTLSVSDTRRTPSTDESRESVKATTPEVEMHQQQQRHQQHLVTSQQEQLQQQTPRSRVPQPCCILLDASGNPHEVVDLDADNESLLGEPDSHEAEREKKRQEMISRQLKRREEQEQKRLKREAEAAAKREEAQRKFEEQERKKEAERQKKEAILREYKDQKNEERLGPVEKEIRAMQKNNSAKKKTSQLGGHLTTTTTASLPKGVSPDRYMRGRSPSHQNLAKPSSASPMLCSSIQDIQAGYAPIDTMDGVEFHNHTPLVRHEGGGLRAGSVTRKVSRPLSTHGGSVSTLNNDNQSETQSIAGVDYSGPRLYVQPSQRTNKKIIANSLSQCCLAGAVNKDLKNKVLAELENSDAKHFLILFRDSGCQYRGVFGFDPDSEVVEKITGSGPKTVAPSMVEKFFKYSSGGKKFTEIYAKQISVTIDAFTIHNHLWQTAKARNGSKTRPVSMYN